MQFTWGGSLLFSERVCPFPTLNELTLPRFSNLLIGQDEKNCSCSGSLNRGTTSSIITIAMLCTTSFTVLSYLFRQPVVEDGKDETSAVRMMAASVAPCIKFNPTNYQANRTNTSTIDI